MILLSCSDDDDNGGQIPFRTSQQEAINLINEFKQNVAGNAGPNAIALTSKQVADLGELMILCDNETLITNVSGNPLRTFPSDKWEVGISNISNETTRFDWSREYGTQIDLGLKLANKAIEVAFSNQSVDRMEIELALTTPIFTRIVQPQDMMNTFIDKAEQRQLPGNIIVSSIISANIQLRYNAYSTANQKVDLDLSAAINENAEVNGGYTQSKSSAEGLEIIEESSDNPTAFAILFVRVPDVNQDVDYINTQTQEECTIDVRAQRLFGVDQSTNELIADIEIEESEATGRRRWFLTVKSLADQKMIFDMGIAVRNIYGQIVAAEQPIVGFIDPGEITAEDEIFFGGIDIPLAESSITVTLSNVRYF